jgi:hypothetical protein
MSAGFPVRSARLTLIAALVLLAAAINACGSERTASKASLPRTTDIRVSAGVPVAVRDPTDRDDDRPGSGRHDPDNDQSSTFGLPATVAQKRMFEVVIRSYYAVAAAGDGARACSLLYWLAAETLVNEQKQGKLGPARSCARLAAAQFDVRHAELREDARELALAEARVRERRAVALVVFAARRERLVPLHREGSTWKMDVLLDAGAP